MRIASVDVCLDPGYLVLICTHIIINYLSINVISLSIGSHQAVLIRRASKT